MGQKKNALEVKIPKALIKLQQLIVSLSPTEKNIFKKYIRKYSDNNQQARYIKLFDCVNDAWLETDREVKAKAVHLPWRSDLEVEVGYEHIAMSQIFFEKFKSRYRLRNIAKTEDLNAKANYLYYRILEALRTANTEKSAHRELVGMMLDIHMLYKKELFGPCLELVREAQKLAQKTEFLPYMLELLRLERRIAATTIGTVPPAALRKVFQKEQQVLKQLELSTALYDLYLETTYLNQAKMKLDDDEIVKGKINQLLDDIMNDSPDAHPLFEIKYNQYNIIINLIRLSANSSFLEFFKQRNFDFFDIMEKRLDLFETHPHQITEDKARYKTVVVNYIGHAFGRRGAVDLDKFAPVLADVNPADPDFLSTVVYVNLLKSITDKDFAKAQAYLEQNKVYEVLGLHGGEIQAVRRQMIYYHGGLVYFVREDFKEAAEWYEGNMGETSALKMSTVLIASEFFAMLARFEIGLPRRQEFKRTRLALFNRRLEKDKLAKDSFEFFLIESLDKIIDTKKEGNGLQVLATRLLPVAKDFIDGKPLLTPFNVYLAWLESKIEGKPLRYTINKYL
jgi:hypothetical protein